MGVLSVFLLVVFGITCVLLLILILLQDEQSEGLGGIFGGGASNQVGNRKGNILTKTSTVLGVLFLVVAFSLAWLNRTQGLGGIETAAKSKASQVDAKEWWKPLNSTPSGTSAAPSTPAAPAPASTVPASSTTPAPSNATKPAAPAGSTAPSPASPAPKP